MNEKQRKVYDILLMPIKNTSHSKGKIVIELKKSIIESTQTYYSSLDEDMSDFAIGFYEILYSKHGNIVDDSGNLRDCCFAGDIVLIH